MQTSEKLAAKDFWEQASCGEELYLNGFEIEDYQMQSAIRYNLEPEIIKFISNFDINNKKVLEIGVGLGADHAKLAEKGANLYGIDLTSRAVNHTKRRFNLLGLTSQLMVSDAENLPFNDDFFDGVYSWGVIHHSPKTEAIAREIYRVLKKGGEARIMIYHKYSVVGFMLWMRYALMKLKFGMTLQEIYSKYLESPGTKAYSYQEARELFNDFEIVDISTPLSHGDLLSSKVGQRHRGIILNLAKKLFPRNLIKYLFPNNGLYMMVSLKK